MKRKNKSKKLVILGIETSCDDSSIALYKQDYGLLAHTIQHQYLTHHPYGGVVPELASRDHLQHTMPLITAALASAQVSMQDLDLIAYTKGPGLAGSLLIGATIGASLGWASKIPVLGVHHLEAHVLAVMLADPAPAMPFIALLVSGGHTMLIQVINIGNYIVLGRTQDDAAGEALDKIAKLLGLPYPGGPALAKLAQEGRPRFSLPLPLVNKQHQTTNCMFSFSGLKTAATRLVQQLIAQQQFTHQDKADLAYAVEQAVIDVLLAKCRYALLSSGYRRLVLVGGVAANTKLRQAMQHMLAELDGQLYVPAPEFCTDNGAMVAYTGLARWLNHASPASGIHIQARWPLETVNFNHNT